MDEQTDDIPLDVWIKFNVVVNVPFAEPYSQIIMSIAAITKHTLVKIR